jgi:hypothetical protein
MWFRKRKDSDFHAEIEQHIRLEADRLIADGMPSAEAHATARRAFGNVVRVQETYYESRRWMWWAHVWRDLRFGLRLLRKSPAFTVAAVLTIALGVGANTAVFQLVDAVLLQSLAVESPKELVFIEPARTAPRSGAPPYPCLARLSDRANSFTGLAVYATDEMRIEIDGRPEAVFGQVATANYFDLLGVKPALGRLLEPNDDRLVVIGSRYWERRFNRDPGVLGKSIVIGQRIFTIAGVTAPDFQGVEPGRPVDLTIPIDTADGIQTYVGPWWFDAIARLKSGVSASGAQAAANGVYHACMLDSGARIQAGRPALPWLDLTSAAYGTGTLRGRFSKPCSR